MVRIYSEEKIQETEYKLIGDIKSYFDRKISINKLNEEEKKALLDVDNAVIENLEYELVRTPFGVTSKEHLSSGLKTALVAMHVARLVKNSDKYVAINVISCGENALGYAMRAAEKSNDNLVLVQEPTEVADTEYEGQINYNEGAFIGNIKEYDHFLFCAMADEPIENWRYSKNE